jgi:hypothetical protein
MKFPKKWLKVGLWQLEEKRKPHKLDKKSIKQRFKNIAKKAALDLDNPPKKISIKRRIPSK